MTGFRRYLILALAVAFISATLAFPADAQTKKKKRSRRARPAAAKPVITNPTIAPPSDVAPSDDIKIISTADQAVPGETSDTAPSAKKPAARPATDAADMQQTLNSLSDQVKNLNNKLGQMQENDRYLADMERLTRAEQRAEGLRSQLIDVQSRIADYESRLEQIEYNLKPENIDRSTQGYGLTRPEEAREARRRQLEREKANVQAQLKILESSKIRLESSIGTADAEIELLRQKLNQQRDQKAYDEMSGPKPKKPE
jgi:predicted  nucleic acid-binding Zn-ribbon protein